MRDTTKKGIAILTAATCLGAGGWAIAAESDPTATTGTPAQAVETQQALPLQQTATPDGDCPEGGPGGAGEAPADQGQGQTPAQPDTTTTPATSGADAL